MRQPIEHADRLADAAAAGQPAAVAQSRRQVEQRAFEQREVHRRAVVQVQVVAMQPLPQLRARDLGGGGVFHQVVDRHAAVAVEPCGEIPHTDLDVAVEAVAGRSEEHTSELQSLMRISYAVFCLKKKKKNKYTKRTEQRYL